MGNYIMLCSKFGVKEQTGPGVKATGADNTWVPVDHRGGLPATANEIIIAKTVNGNKGAKRAVVGPITGAHNIRTLGVTDSFTGWFLKWLFGVHAVAGGGGTGAYKHTYNAASCNDLYYFTMHNNMIAAVTDCVNATLGGMTISFAANDLLEFSYPVVYTHDELASARTLTFSERTPLSWADAVLEINGVPFTTGENFNFAITNGAASVPTINGKRYGDKTAAPGWDVEFGVSLEFDSDTHLRRVWGDAAAVAPTNAIYEGTFRATFISPEEIASSGVYYKMDIYMPRFVYKAFTVEGADVESRIIQNITGAPLVDDVEGYDVQIELYNGDSDYPDAT